MPTHGFAAAVFDVDGVLVDSPHERAWQDSLRVLMEGEWSGIRDRTTWSPEAFSPQVYQETMSGKPRMSGALAALEYFKFPDAQGHVETYAARKQDMVIELIRAGEFEAYPDALRFLMAVRAAGILTAAASSSKNAGLLLRKIRLDTFAEKQGLTYDFLRPGLSLADGGAGPGPRRRRGPPHRRESRSRRHLARRRRRRPARPARVVAACVMSRH